MLLAGILLLLLMLAEIHAVIVDVVGLDLAVVSVVVGMNLAIAVDVVG